jgi:hypothetical protein
MGRKNGAHLQKGLNHEEGHSPGRWQRGALDDASAADAQAMQAYAANTLNWVVGKADSCYKTRTAGQATETAVKEHTPCKMPSPLVADCMSVIVRVRV